MKLRAAPLLVCPLPFGDPFPFPLSANTQNFKHPTHILQKSKECMYLSIYIYESSFLTTGIERTLSPSPCSSPCKSNHLQSNHRKITSQTTMKLQKKKKKKNQPKKSSTEYEEELVVPPFVQLSSSILLTSLFRGLIQGRQLIFAICFNKQQQQQQHSTYRETKPGFLFSFSCYLIPVS